MWLEIEIRVLDLESLMCVLFGCLSETDSYKTCWLAFIVDFRNAGILV